MGNCIPCFFKRSGEEVIVTDHYNISPNSEAVSMVELFGNDGASFLFADDDGVDVLIERKSKEEYKTTFILSKMLNAQTKKSYAINGIIIDVFVRNVFPSFTDFGLRLYYNFYNRSSATKNYMLFNQFFNETELFINLFDKYSVIEYFVSTYACPDDLTKINDNNFKKLLKVCFQIVFRNSSEQSNECEMLNFTLNSLVDSCFCTKTKLTVIAATNWIFQNCPRIIEPLNIYCINNLTVKCDSIGCIQYKPNFSIPKIDYLNLVLDGHKPQLMSISQAWILSNVLPKIYSRYVKSTNQRSQLITISRAIWSQIYNIEVDGFGTNNFIRKVIGYKGPTLILLRTVENEIIAVCNSSKWRVSYENYGDCDCCLLKLYPIFKFIAKGPYMIFVNTIIGNFPTGIRIGFNHNYPILSIDKDFISFEFNGVPFQLLSMEAWGCGCADINESSEQDETQFNESTLIRANNSNHFRNSATEFYV